jgi:hypothetical protein
VIEDIREVPDLTTTRRLGQVHCEVSRRHLSSTLREKLERASDQAAETIAGRRDENEQKGNNEKRDVTEMADLLKGGLG